jgi:hypothetical protein
MPETFFPIAPDVPVAIVAFGANDMMGVPWETIVRMYARQLGTQTFATLEEYAASFFAFIERSNSLYPSQLQAERVRRCVASLWTDYRDRIEAISDGRVTTSAAERRADLATILYEDRRDCERRPDLAALGEGFGARVVATYGDQIDQLEFETFGDLQLTQQVRSELRSILALMYEKEWCHPHDESEIAIAGMGDDEPFPSLLVYSVGTVVAGRGRVRGRGRPVRAPRNDRHDRRWDPSRPAGRDPRRVERCRAGAAWQSNQGRHARTHRGTPHGSVHVCRRTVATSRDGPGG